MPPSMHPTSEVSSPPAARRYRIPRRMSFFGVEDLRFQNGHDLEAFLEKRKLDASVGEVEQ